MTAQVQDFSRKMTIVIRNDVASWQLTNTVAHIAAYLGNKLTEPFDTGSSFVSKDGKNFPRNSQYAIVALKASKEQLAELLANVHESDLLWIAYVQEMIDFLDDDELAGALQEVSSEDMNLLGLGLFGPSDQLRALTNSLKLWK